MARIAVIIVNYNAAELAVRAVESVLERQHSGQSVTVHLVDNASPEGDAQVLEAAAEQRGWGDRVVLHLEAENHGFGRGNNLVMRQLADSDEPPDYIFLLNPDAALKNEAISELTAFLDAHPKVAVAGARIESPDGPAVTAAFNFPSAISEFSSGVAFGPIDRLFARWRVPLSPDLPKQQVDWVAGAAMMARLNALQDVDYFDPAYFLYYEEVDLMRRLRKAGWETWFVPKAIAIHEEGRSTGVKSGKTHRKRSPSYLYDSWRIYYVSQLGRGMAILTAFCRLFGVLLGNLVAFLLKRSTPRPLMFYGDFTRIVLRPLFGMKAIRHD